MDPKDMISYMQNGKVVLWLDDRIDHGYSRPFTLEYLKSRTIAVLPDITYALYICDLIHAKEKEKGKIPYSRFILSTNTRDVVCNGNIVDR